MINQHAIADVVGDVKVVISSAQFQNKLNDLAVSLVNPKQKYYSHKCY